MQCLVGWLGSLCLALALAGLAHAEEGIRLASGFALQKLPPALTPTGPWHDTPSLCQARGRLWLANRDNVWLLGQTKGEIELSLPIEALACSEAGTLVLAVGGRLGPLQGKLFLPRLALPSPHSRVAGGAGDSLILYETQAPARLMRFDGRQVQLVATFAEPIRAATHAGEFLIVATTSGIYRVRPGEPLGLIASLPDFGQVVSLAVHPRTAEILVSTADALYVVDEGLIMQVAAGLGGALVATEEGIFIADGRRRAVFRLYSPAPPDSEASRAAAHAPAS